MIRSRSLFGVIGQIICLSPSIRALESEIMNDWKANLKTTIVEADRARQVNVEKAKQEYQDREKRNSGNMRFMREVVKPAFHEFEHEVANEFSVACKISDRKAELRVDDGQLLVYTLDFEGDVPYAEERYFDGESDGELRHRLAAGHNLNEITKEIVGQSLVSALKKALKGMPH